MNISKYWKRSWGSCLVIIHVSALSGAEALATSKGEQLLNSCPTDNSRWCESTKFCVGINTGFFGHKDLDRAFIDQAKGAALEVDQFGRPDILRNPDTPLDDNKYPTQANRQITMRFYTTINARFPLQRMPSGRFVVLWDGAARNTAVTGEGVSNIAKSRNRIAFDLDTSVRGEALFTYVNPSVFRHVTNIRIVPVAYEADYKNWSWSRYRVGAVTNPPIFFKEWLDKMSRGCVIRYMNSTHTNDKNVILLKRDSSLTRIKPSYSVWYEGFGLGNQAERRHRWPWELIAEASLQTGTHPWINFRVYSFENLKAGDSLIANVSRMFKETYGGPIYVEYGNEIWNYGTPFTTSSDHVKFNGPGRNDNIGENYALRNNAIQRVFARGYGDKACLVQGVVGGQTRNPWHAQQRLMHADDRYSDIVSPATYVGDNMSPGNPTWAFVDRLYGDVRAGRLTRSEAYDVIKDELLSGDLDVIQKNWRNDVAPFVQIHIDLAKERGMCTAIYESGLNFRVDRIDLLNPKHKNIAEFVRGYRLSSQQAEVEKEIYDWLSRRSKGPAAAYANVSSAGNGAFAYWDTMFDPRSMDSPRTKLIEEFADVRAPLIDKISKVQRRITRTVDSMYRIPRHKALLVKKLEQLTQAVRRSQSRRAARALTQFRSRIDGCGRAPDSNDYLRSCPHQRIVQRMLRKLETEIVRL